MLRDKFVLILSWFKVDMLSIMICLVIVSVTINEKSMCWTFSTW